MAGLHDADDKTPCEAERIVGPKRKRRAGGPAPAERPTEIAGPTGPEPTRYGDWERRGLAVDF